MRIVNINLCDITTRVLFIGMEGEQDHTQVVFDMTPILKDYPDATAALSVKPPVGDIYPVAVSRVGDLVVWEVSAADCAHHGDGTYQLTFTNGTEIIKTLIGNFRVYVSLIGNGTAPTPVQEWLQAAQEALGELEDLSASAHDLEYGQEATAEIETVGGHKNISIGVPGGKDGEDGVSPVITVTDITGGHRLSITDAEGTRTVDVMDGVDGDPGEPGQPGADGFSPVITVTDITGGHRLSITTKTGTQTVDVLNGEKGEDGYSPSASVSKSGHTATITITDKSGTTTAEVSDGDPEYLIDDTTPALDKTFSSSKIDNEFTSVKSALQVLEPSATSGDVGKFLKAKTVADGKVTEYEFGSGGGSGGTSDYDDLTDKPQINGVTLSGDKAGSDIGLLDAPSTAGTSGQVLLSDGNGGQVWGSPGTGTIVVDSTLSVAGAAADAAATGVIKDAVGCSKTDHGLSQYFYKADTYIRSGAETSLSGYDLYKIPVSLGDIVEVKQTSGESDFWGLLNKAYVFATIYNNTYRGNSYDVTANYTFTTSQRRLFGYTKAGYSAVMVCIQHGNENLISVNINANDDIDIVNSMFAEKKDFPFQLNNTNCFVSKNYITESSAQITSIADPYTCYIHTINGNDRIVFNSARYSGISYYGTFVTKDDFTASRVLDSTFIAPEDGFVCIFEDESNPLSMTYVRSSVKVDYSQIINTPDSPFNGMSAVAFGTSLTYRSRTSYGYLTHLPTLSGMTVDNQGVGSSTILGNGGSTDMLAKIKAYGSYSGKRVCLIEGFVNDWYQSKTLGTWKDTGETTVCGCVRSALNYVLSQNANLTVFLILDPYGRNYSGVDCSTTAVNSSGLTQFEFYEEIAKVAESLGIPAIKEYSGSQISENTPQFIADNIHPNALGAKQSANYIWSRMKQHYANEIS